MSAYGQKRTSETHVATPVDLTFWMTYNSSNPVVAEVIAFFIKDQILALYEIGVQNVFGSRYSQVSVNDVPRHYVAVTKNL